MYLGVADGIGENGCLKGAVAAAQLHQAIIQIAVVLEDRLVVDAVGGQVEDGGHGVAGIGERLQSGEGVVGGDTAVEEDDAAAVAIGVGCGKRVGSRGFRAAQDVERV